MNEKNGLPVLNIDFRELPEYKDAKSRQEALVADNPFVEITDNATYDVAKKARTALRSGRYELQKGEKLIASKIKEFRDYVKNETESLISITLPHEEKQQSEVEKWEEVKRQEKEEKERLENERIQKHKNEIISFRDSYQSFIEQATLQNIDAVITEIGSSNRDFEEFIPDFEAVKESLLEKANNRKERLQLDAEKAEIAAKQAEIDRENEAKAKAEKEKAEALQKLENARSEYKTVTGEDAAPTLTADQITKKISDFKEAQKRKTDEEHQKLFKADKEKLLKMVRSMSIDWDPGITLDNKESENLAAEFIGEADTLMQKYIQLVKNL